eukprot:1832846-Rhodomonas_salina.1
MMHADHKPRHAEFTEVQAAKARNTHCDTALIRLAERAGSDGARGQGGREGEEEAKVGGDRRGFGGRRWMRRRRERKTEDAD